MAPTMPAVATLPGKSYAGSGIFFIEDVERCQADVSDFLLSEGNLPQPIIIRREISRKLIGFDPEALKAPTQLQSYPNESSGSLSPL